MNNRLIPALALFALVAQASAQNTTKGTSTPAAKPAAAKVVRVPTINPEHKKIWAKSFLHKKGPELVVEKWLTDQPNTEGKLVLVDFWATWCGPCRQAIPHLNRFQKMFPNQLAVIGLSDESEEKVRAMKEPVIDYALAIDRQSRMEKTVGVAGIPHVLIMDPQGIVRWEGNPLSQTHPLNERTIQILISRHCKPAKTQK